MLNKRSLVSVIVPVYNVGPFLKQCLDSLRDQTYEHYEVIIVDDGSTDQSGMICDQYAIRHPKFVVYHTQNCGLSAARNFGVAHSHGDYLLFVDSDDEILPDTLKRASSYLDGDTDSNLVIFSYKRIDQNGNIIDPDTEARTFPHTGTVYPYKALVYLLEERFNNFSWRILFEKSIWFDNDISFPDGLLYEDIRTTYRFLLGARKVTFLNEQLYLYRQRKNSIIHEATAHSIEESRTAILNRNALLCSRFPEFKEICAANIYKWNYGVLMNPNYVFSRKPEIRNLIIAADNYIRNSERPKSVNKMLNWKQRICLLIIQIGGHQPMIVLVSALKKIRTIFKRVIMN